MDVTIDQVAFSRALRLANRIVSTRAISPILQTVLLSADSDHLTLTATDTKLGMTMRIPATVAGPGDIAVPARLLAEYVAHLPSEPIRLQLDPTAKRVQARCGRFTATLTTVTPQDFPRFQVPDGGLTVELEAARLREAIEKVVVVATRDETRPILSSVLFDLTPTRLVLAATDGFRLARAGLSLRAGGQHQLLVPARAATECARLLVGATRARLLVPPDGRKLTLVVDEITFGSSLIEGCFPDVERLIPTDWRTRLTVERAAFRKTLQVARLFGHTEPHPLVLDAAPDRLLLRALGDETGEAQTELPVALEGEPQVVVLNTQLLAEVVEVVRGRHLQLSWVGPHTPVVIRDPEAADPANLSLIMPIYDPALQQPTAA